MARAFRRPPCTTLRELTPYCFKRTVARKEVSDGVKSLEEIARSDERNQRSRIQDSPACICTLPGPRRGRWSRRGRLAPRRRRTPEEKSARRNRRMISPLHETSWPRASWGLFHGKREMRNLPEALFYTSRRRRLCCFAMQP